MKRIGSSICLIIALSTAPASAEMNMGRDHAMNASQSPAYSARPGKQIRHTDLKGYTLTYRLLNQAERGEMAKMMGHHAVIGMSKSPEVTNHLMVYIEKPKGEVVPGEVAFFLKGPDGREFRTMTMGMYGGYGADVVMKLKGAYTIRAKIAPEGMEQVDIDDEFVYHVR